MNLELELADYKVTLVEVLRNANLLPFYKSVGKILYDATQSQFKTDGAYFQRGSAWMPLAPSTVKWRIKNDYAPILILRRRGGDAGLLGSIDFSAYQDYVEIGTNLEYAKYLHFGTRFMPARPIFPENEFPPEVIEDIADALDKFVSRLIN